MLCHCPLVRAAFQKLDAPSNSLMVGGSSRAPEPNNFEDCRLAALASCCIMLLQNAGDGATVAAADAAAVAACGC